MRFIWGFSGGGTFKLCTSVCLFSISQYQIKSRTLTQTLEEIDLQGVCLGEVVPSNSVKTFASEICTDIKNTGIVNLVMQKFDFWGSTLGGTFWGGGTLKLCQNICLLYLLISKNKTGALVWGKQNINIWRVHFGGLSKGGFQMMSKHTSLRYGLIFKKN